MRVDGLGFDIPGAAFDGGDDFDSQRNKGTRLAMASQELSAELAVDMLEQAKEGQAQCTIHDADLQLVYC